MESFNCTDTIKNKLSKVVGTPLGLYNANTPTSLDSLREGARGLSAISANFYPELYTALCKGANETRFSQQADRLQQHLSIMDAVTRIKYPLSAKVFLGRRGLKMDPYTRVNVLPLNFEERKMLEALFDHYRMIVEQFKY